MPGPVNNKDNSKSHGIHRVNEHKGSISGRNVVQGSNDNFDDIHSCASSSLQSIKSTELNSASVIHACPSWMDAVINDLMATCNHMSKEEALEKVYNAVVEHAKSSGEDIKWSELIRHCEQLVSFKYDKDNDSDDEWDIDIDLIKKEEIQAHEDSKATFESKKRGIKDKITTSISSMFFSISPSVKETMARVVKAILVFVAISSAVIVLNVILLIVAIFVLVVFLVLVVHRAIKFKSPIPKAVVKMPISMASLEEHFKSNKVSVPQLIREDLKESFKYVLRLLCGRRIEEFNGFRCFDNMDGTAVIFFNFDQSTARVMMDACKRWVHIS